MYSPQSPHLPYSWPPCTRHSTTSVKCAVIPSIVPLLHLFHVNRLQSHFQLRNFSSQATDSFNRGLMQRSRFHLMQPLLLCFGTNFNGQIEARMNQRDGRQKTLAPYSTPSTPVSSPSTASFPPPALPADEASWNIVDNN